MYDASDMASFMSSIEMGFAGFFGIFGIDAHP